MTLATLIRSVRRSRNGCWQSTERSDFFRSGQILVDGFLRGPSTFFGTFPQVATACDNFSATKGPLCGKNRPRSAEKLPHVAEKLSTACGKVGPGCGKVARRLSTVFRVFRWSISFLFLPLPSHSSCDAGRLGCMSAQRESRPHIMNKKREGSLRSKFKQKLKRKFIEHRMSS